MKWLQGRWARMFLGAQAAAAVVLVVACVRSPGGVEEERYSGVYRSHFDELYGGSLSGDSEEAVGEEEKFETLEDGTVVYAADACPGCGPPFHAANTDWHVLDSHTGTKPTIHRLATQWHNGNTRWAFHTPASTWRWVYTSGTSTTTPTTES